MNSEKVLSFFKEITKIPRESGHEEHIIAYLQEFAAQRGLECKTDEAGNVLIVKEAASGHENVPAIVLQSHSDMVCEKNEGVEHDFAKDPIRYIIKDGWMIAPDTTLGADCGIGVAAQMAVLVSDMPCGKIECLFTTAEETGLDGAMALQPGFFSGKVLLNLDSEDEGEIFIGCAGGIDTLAKMHYEPITIDNQSEKYFPILLRVSGLMGGHSGDDINKGRANANQLLVWFIERIWKQTPLQLATINGGNLRNAIAREAEAVICVPMSYKEQVRIEWNHHIAEMEDKYGSIEKEMRLDLESCDMPHSFIPSDKAYRLIMALCACPHGMTAMSKEMPGLVETSTNLASIKMREDERGAYIEVNTSQRSSKEASKHHLKWIVEQALALACDEVTHGDGYPGWAPNPNSPLLEVTKRAYSQLFNEEPKVLAIHAGLECGLFLEKYPYLDMVSVGPQMYGVHSPQERLSIPSTEKCYQWLCQILQSL